MSFYNILSYAVNGLDMCATDLLHSFVNYVMGKFPHNTFKPGAIFVDSLGTVNDHKRRFNGLENPSRIDKPIATVTIDGGLSDVWSKEDNGPDSKQYSMFPGTTTDRRLINDHRLGMFYDRKTGIYLDTIEIRRKLELDFKFEFDTKSDVNTIKSYLYNTLSIRKNSYLDDVTTNIILPNSLIFDISKLAFNMNEFSISNYDDLLKLSSYLNENGFYDFYVCVKDVDPNVSWFLMNRVLRISYFINEMDQKDGSDNEKNGEVYDKFLLNLHATIDFKLPNSYILSYKPFNAPNKSVITIEYLNNLKLNKLAEIPASFCKNKYIEDREYIKPVKNNFELIVREEFLIENETEYIQLSNFFPIDSIYREILYRLSKEERRNMFDVHLYENGVLIEDSSIEIRDLGSDIVYTIKNCDTEVSFMIYIYCNKKDLIKYLPIIYKRIEKSIFPNTDENDIPLYVGSIPPTGLNIIPPFSNWESDIEYQKDTKIIYNDILYIALENSENIIPDTDETKWKILVKYWNETTEYKVNDFVIYNSLLYKVIADNINHIPTISYTYFKFITILGEDRNSNFKLPYLYEEPAIGGRYLKGGLKTPFSKNKGVIETFNSSIFALRK